MYRIYKELLYDPNISYNMLIESTKRPKCLYKYQHFYSSDSKENIYWKDNIQGAFHLSLGCEFEDVNDCRPYFKSDTVRETIYKLIKSKTNNQKLIQGIYLEMKKKLTDDYFNSIISNYQHKLRVGCFTKSSDNKAMWRKYGNNSTGFCIEYSTDKNKLLRYSTLPVVYTDDKFDSSIPFAVSLVMECYRKAKKRTLEQNIGIFNDEYEKSIKFTYIPVYVKQTKWNFEDEYRMLLLPHRNTPIGMIEAEKELDRNCNINLKEAIAAIYLGENFDLNPNYENIKKQILEISNSMKINVFQKKLVHNEYINIKIS